MDGKIKKYDILIIGAGPAGHNAALKLGAAGKKIAVIETSDPGGTCLNRGCIPTTLLLNIAEFIKRLKNADEIGIELNSGFSINMDKIIKKKNYVIDIQRKGIRQSFKSHSIDFFENYSASFEDKKTICVKKNSGDETFQLTADKIVIASGSVSHSPADFEIDNKNIFLSDNIFDLNIIPKSIAVIGAGVTGCEFAYFFNELGSEVFLIDSADAILPIGIDEDIHKVFIREIKKNKINIQTSQTIEECRVNGNSCLLRLSGGVVLNPEKILVSAGRRGNIAGLNLGCAGIETDKKNFIVTDKNYMTTAPDVFAIGDIRGKFLYAHTAAAEGVALADIIMGNPRRYDFNFLPFTVFTYPEIGWVGLTEKQAIEQKIPIKKGIFHFRASGRAHTLGEISGLVKIIVNADTERIIGGHIIGSRATDLIHTVIVAMKNNIKFTDISEIIAAHPSMTESLIEAVNAVS